MDQTKSGIEEYTGINSAAFFGVGFAAASLVFGAFIWGQTGSLFMLGASAAFALLAIFLVLKEVGLRGLASAIRKHWHGWAVVATAFAAAALFTIMSTHMLDAILG